MPRRSHESLGDYISSACFGGVAFLSLLNGLEAFLLWANIEGLSNMVCLFLTGSCCFSIRNCEAVRLN